MNDPVTVLYVFCISTILIGLAAYGLLKFDEVRCQNVRLQQKIDRWLKSTRQHRQWFIHEHNVVAVLNNIENFAMTSRPDEYPYTEAMELRQDIWRKQAEEARKVFNRLAGEPMGGMSGDEMTQYILGAALNEGPTSHEFKASVTWLVSQWERQRDLMNATRVELKEVSEELRDAVESSNADLQATPNEGARQ